MNGIPKLVQEYNTKYSKYLYYCWIQQSTVLKQPSRSYSNTNHIFPSLPSCRTLRYIPTTYTSTTNVTLNWVNFAEFYELLISNEELKTYAIEHYLDLTHFLISWSSYKKHIFVPLLGPKWTPSNAWRLGLGGIGLK